MTKFLKNTYSEAKLIPKTAWITAIIVPGGIIALASYLVSVSIYKQKKVQENDRSKNS